MRAIIETGGKQFAVAPNQTIRVGHASPACKFTAVDVFGAEE